jgi:hypothetical protein
MNGGGMGSDKAAKTDGISRVTLKKTEGSFA